MRSLALATLSSMTIACGGGDIVSAAEKAADAACACTDLACAKDVVAQFNKMSIKKGEEKAALDADAKAKFDAAVNRMSECRDKLK